MCAQTCGSKPEQVVVTDEVVVNALNVKFSWSTLKYMYLLRWLQINESDIEGGGAGILVQVDGDPVPSTYYIYTTKHGYAYLC